MFVVGYLYNNNGMATWCWEAAHALHRAGKEVILAASEDVRLPGEPEMEVVRVGNATSARSGLARSAQKVFEIIWQVAFPKPDGILPKLHEELLKRGKQPTAYLLNQTTMVDLSVPTLQYIVAWAYPVSLGGYLGKTKVMMQSKHPLAKPRMFLWILGMWRQDWRAYRQAAGVLAVTGTLRDSLSQYGVKAFRVYPGTQTSTSPLKPHEGPRRILIAAALLDEPRKRIPWMLKALAGLDGLEHCELLLVGVPGPEVEAAVARLKFSVTILGRLRRDELQKLMTECDVFCFGSKMDDWGYVVAEAVSNGMIVVAPNQSPFDEIVGGTGCMFDPSTPESFADQLQHAVNLTPEEAIALKQKAREHATNALSNEVFAQILIDIAESIPGQHHSKTDRT